MRLALISDIHGNGIALDAVLADIDRQGADTVICLGDTATIGPQPKQVLDTLRSLNCICIMGNHDAALLHPDKAIEYKIALPLLSALNWTAQQLTNDHLNYLHSFIATVEIALGHDTVMLCYHGSPKSNTDLILATTPADELDRFLAGQTTAVLAGGHSHIQMLRQHEGRLVVNPGSVGNAFLRTPLPDVVPTLLPWAEYALVSWSKRALSVDLRRVPFDTEALKEVVSQSDIPIKNWWLQQYSGLNGRLQAGQ